MTRYTTKKYHALPQRVKDGSTQVLIDLYELEYKDHGCKDDDLCLQCVTIEMLIEHHKRVMKFVLFEDFLKSSMDGMFDDITVHTEIILKMIERIKALESKVL